MKVFKLKSKKRHSLSIHIGYRAKVSARAARNGKEIKV